MEILLCLLQQHHLLSQEHDGIKIEAHILDFNRDIYGEIVELELLDFVRPELKFDSIEELFEQIAKDVLVTRNR